MGFTHFKGNHRISEGIIVFQSESSHFKMNHCISKGFLSFQRYTSHFKRLHLISKGYFSFQDSSYLTGTYLTSRGYISFQGIYLTSNIDFINLIFNINLISSFQRNTFQIRLSYIYIKAYPSHI